VIVEPYKRPVPRFPVGLVTSTRRVLLEDGSSVLLRDCPVGLKLYADAHMVNLRFLRRGDGTAIAWNDRPVRWLPDLERHHEVILLQGFPGESEDTLAGLATWRDVLHDAGARIGSPASSSFSLFKATLAGPTFLGGGLGRPKFRIVGGRQEAFFEPGVYGSFVQVDMQAAYGATLGALSYAPGGAWVKVDRLPADPEAPCFVRARVSTYGLDVGPIPVRPRSRPKGAAKLDERIDYPIDRHVQGIYSRAELEAAERAGCGVRVLAVYMLLGVRLRLFERWWSVISEGRKLPGYAGDLFKQTGNTLWGRFALDGVKTHDRYQGGSRVSSVVRGGVNPAFGAPDISELVTASVRARLYSELIAPHAERLISVHTDGGLVRAPFDHRMPRGWRRKGSGSILVYLGPQLYAYRPHGDRAPLTYVVSGISPPSAPTIFGGLCRSWIGWPPTQGGSTEVRDRRRLDRLVRELDATEGAA